ncbi:MAG: CBS domain-containing protein [Synechococcaceae cyanobacterium SM2_3_1]|nr:CBS domain-containing protein [Synechococcaceae cyanobacterium SM2_3_1]
MNKTVAEVMSSDPLVVRPETPLKDVIQLLAKNRISGLPVVDAKESLVGVISESDLMWQETGVSPPAFVMLLDSVIFLQNPATYERELHKSLGQTAAEVMTPHPVTIHPDKSVKAAARLMHDRKVPRLIVLDDDKKVVGVITQGDIIQAMAAEEAD